MKRAWQIRRNQSGIALITVLLILSILVAAALELNYASRADVFDAANLSDGVKLYYIAKSGFYGAAALLAHAQNDYDTLRDDWAHAEILSANSKSFFPNGQFVVRIEDEQGKVPLQRLVHDGVVDENVRSLLLRLLTLPEFQLEANQARDIVDAIIDWIDENDEVTGRGAESSYYQSLSPAYSAKNAPLDCIEELLMIKGITREIFAGTSEKPGLGSLVTIYGSGAVNPATAPKWVLRALDERITAELADRMDEYRKAKSSNLSTIDWYKKVPGMEAITIKPELITMVKSSHFKIYATGVADRMERHITGVIRRPYEPNEKVSIVAWRQD